MVGVSEPHHYERFRVADMGTPVDSDSLQHGHMPATVDLADYDDKKGMLLIDVPGKFTPLFEAGRHQNLTKRIFKVPKGDTAAQACPTLAEVISLETIRNHRLRN